MHLCYSQWNPIQGWFSYVGFVHVQIQCANGDIIISCPLDVYRGFHFSVCQECWQDVCRRNALCSIYELWWSPIFIHNTYILSIFFRLFCFEWKQRNAKQKQENKMLSKHLSHEFTNLAAELTGICHKLLMLPHSTIWIKTTQ